MIKDKANKRLECTKNPYKAIAVANTAFEFNRSKDWVYRVLRGEILNENTRGVQEYFTQELKTIESLIKK